MSLGPELGERLVAALYGRHGEHPGFRAAHAKGSCCVGTFTATPAAAALSIAPHLGGRPLAVKVRFSNGSGIPAYPDYARSDGRGMAVKFALDDGRHVDMVALTLPVFFVRTPEDFLEFLGATTPDPATGQPDLGRVGEFLERHPETRQGIEVALGGTLPASYLTTRYNGIHTFRLVDAAGEGRWCRYRWEPEAGEQATTSAEARAGGREYLQDELRARLGGGPAGFRLVFVLGAADDPITDPTAQWPEDRESVVAGRLELAAMVADQAADCEADIFDPTNVVEGFECSEDPVLLARSNAYAASFTRRRGLRSPAPARGAEGIAPSRMPALPEPGQMLAVDAGGSRVAVANVDGALHAFGDVCTHRNCSLSEGSLEGGVVTCPCHGAARFDVATGAVVRGPAREPVPTFAVRRDGLALEVGGG